MTSRHDDVVREQFRLQAPTFTDSGFAVDGLRWIVDQLRPTADDQCLEVACGAGHLGRALAPHLAHVNALDLTPEMLAQGDELARGSGLTNISFAVGDAAALPWLDDQFDLTVCRLALHQVGDPEAVVREMVRVTRPGGRVGITDIVLVDPAVAEENTRIERLRDPSHHRTLSVTEIRELLGRAGATVVSTAAIDVERDLEDWMARSRTPDDVRVEIRDRLDDERRGGRPTGLRPTDGDGGRAFVHPWATVVATPAAAV
jgi:SAM-dependent methyltransferase